MKKGFGGIKGEVGGIHHRSRGNIPGNGGIRLGSGQIPPTAKKGQVILQPVLWIFQKSD
ncbi:hypothetical protein [Neobacillus drentensis]|uniref:hypothetical protein n=1 Tax=Neobacillus drentensis TaxID=220684 RepID=UPI002FFF0549